MAFEMIHTGGPYGDCCSSYVVQLRRKYTVQDFVREVLHNKPGEWGNISIVLDFNYTYQTRQDECQYRYGAITTPFSNPEINNAIIDEIKAHGGWTAMDYFIKIAAWDSEG